MPEACLTIVEAKGNLLGFQLPVIRDSGPSAVFPVTTLARERIRIMKGLLEL